jgi:transposase
MSLETEILILRDQLSLVINRLFFLEAEVTRLYEENQILQEKLAISESKLNKNSSNSSKPPSTDTFRTKSLRTQSGKKQGGQDGHKGSTLSIVATPDKTVVHSAVNCSECGNDLSSAKAVRVERRQVFDIPPIRMEVTEHQCETKCCPYCKTENKGSFPLQVSQPTQYGNSLKQFAVYLSNYQLIPYNRCAQLIEDLTGIRPSQATLVNFNNQFKSNLKESGFEADLKQKLLASSALHFDETGFYYDNDRNWLHTATTKDYTYYFPHKKRGQEAMDAMGIISQYKGTAVHDYWKSYLEYNCTHSLCNTHHLRDLTFCEEQEKNQWAAEMKTLLLEMKGEEEQCKTEGLTAMEAEQLEKLESKYDALIIEGYKQNPFPEKEKGKRGAPKKTKSQNMMERFKNHKEDIIRFLKDFTVPFGNNVAEQAMRMMKLKQKISGCFRSEEGAASFAIARSYIDTMRKQNFDIMDAIGKAMEGNPIFPLNLSSA